MFAHLTKLWDSSVGMSSRIRAGRPVNEEWTPGRASDFRFLENALTVREANPNSHSVGKGQG